jgi:drug/metabolite transporter (DMT)-like permease
MELWVGITIAAAFLQNIRSALQKHLKTHMGTTGATFVRFGFGLPVALAYAWLVSSGFGLSLPAPNSVFIGWVTTGALAQVSAQACLVHLFSYRNFAWGNAYSRSEAMFAAFLSVWFFGETIGQYGWLAIGISTIGVLMLTLSKPSAKGAGPTLKARHPLETPAIGLLSGLLFGLAAVSYRAASLSLGGEVFIASAVVTLLVALTIQTVVMLAWMLAVNRSEFLRIAKAWKVSLLVGFVGATATFGWFSAFTLQNAAIVKVVAQIELLLAFLTSWLIFGERMTKLEIAGSLAVVIGILVLLLA